MSAITGDYLLTDDEWEELVWVWQETDTPKGCKAEIIDGLVTVAPYTATAHHAVVGCVDRPLYEVIPEDWGIYHRLPLAEPSRLGLYVPDLAVVPEKALRTGNGNFIPAAAAEFVVEITSKATASNDRTKKAAGYAQAGIALYLLIDGSAPGGPTITLYGEPKGGVYRVLRAGKFGAPMPLPQPFDLELDTSEFPTG
jgi:Uma2 family endonuclease